MLDVEDARQALPAVIHGTVKLPHRTARRSSVREHPVSHTTVARDTRGKSSYRSEYTVTTSPRSCRAIVKSHAASSARPANRRALPRTTKPLNRASSCSIAADASAIAWGQGTGSDGNPESQCPPHTLATADVPRRIASNPSSRWPAVPTPRQAPPPVLLESWDRCRSYPM